MGTLPKNHSSASFAATPTISFTRVVSRLSEVPKGGEKASLCNMAVFCCLRHKCAPTLMAFCNSRRNSMPPSFRLGYPTRLPIQSPGNGRFALIRIRRERFVLNSFQIQPNVTLLSRAESTIRVRPAGAFSGLTRWHARIKALPLSQQLGIFCRYFSRQIVTSCGRDLRS